MLYLKTKLNDLVEIRVNLNETNVFCNCACCEKEIPVNLASAFSQEKKSLYEISMLCPDCQDKMNKKYSNENFPEIR